MTASPGVGSPAPSSLPPLPAFNGIGRRDARARAAYAEAAGIYRIVPAGIVVPSTTAALRELVTWAGKNRIQLVPRGAGSGMAGGNVGEGLLVDLTALDGAPLEMDAGARTITTGAAVTLRDIQCEAERHGLRLPPDPSSARFATAGGMVSTNASGPKSLGKGSVRRWVEALEVVTADGEAIRLRRGAPPPLAGAVTRFVRDVEPMLRAAAPRIRERFPATRKNSSGYALDAWLDSGDLLDLLIGAEGTLAVITGVEWRLEPAPLHCAGVRATLADPVALGSLVPRLLDLHPAAIEYLDGTFLSFVGEPGGEGMLLVELEGDDAAELAARREAAAELMRGAATAVREAADARSLDDLWDIRHAASPLLAQQGDQRRSIQVIEDACVPVQSLGRYVELVRAAGRRHGVQLIVFGHAGDGNLHVNLQPDVTASGWEERVAGIFQEVSDGVLALGGTLSGEHGDGRLRAPILGRVFGEEIVALFRALKAAFDPAGILNPGVKLAAGGGSSLTRLKLGPRAASIPDDVEAGLREIERFARYSVSRLDLADAPGTSDQ